MRRRRLPTRPGWRQDPEAFQHRPASRVVYLGLAVRIPHSLEILIFLHIKAAPAHPLPAFSTPPPRSPPLQVSTGTMRSARASLVALASLASCVCSIALSDIDYLFAFGGTKDPPPPPPLTSPLISRGFRQLHGEPLQPRIGNVRGSWPAPLGGFVLVILALDIPLTTPPSPTRLPPAGKVCSGTLNHVSKLILFYLSFLFRLLLSISIRLGAFSGSGPPSPPLPPSFLAPPRDWRLTYLVLAGFSFNILRPPRIPPTPGSTWQCSVQ